MKMKNQRIKTLELLDKLLAGGQIGRDDLDYFLHNKIKENLFLEYKRWEVLKNNNPCKLIREYISGFANSDGGILIVGVDDKNWILGSCPEQIHGTPLDDWVADCLTPIAPYFSLRPTIQTLNGNGNIVLVIIVPRSINLIPCQENGKLIYYFRFHDKTLSAPDYLISDLYLGRRQNPYLHIVHFNMQGRSKLHNDSILDLTFGLHFRIENQSLAWAEQVKLGMVSWIQETNRIRSSHLQSYVQILDLDDEYVNSKRPYNSFHHVANPQGGYNLDPFQTQTLSFTNCTIPLAMGGCPCNYTWKSAIYVISKNTMPIWYQLNIQVSEELKKAIANNKQNSLMKNTENTFLHLERLPSSRPIVAWEKAKL